jgi:hypothetical protein
MYNDIGGLAHPNKGIYDFKSVIISRVLRILASQNRFQSMYDEI